MPPPTWRDRLSWERLALLALPGIYMFFQPYAAKWRER
jgi:hypothetical protein